MVDVFTVCILTGNKNTSSLHSLLSGPSPPPLQDLSCSYFVRPLSFLVPLSGFNSAHCVLLSVTSDAEARKKKRENNTEKREERVNS